MADNRTLLVVPDRQEAPLAERPKRRQPLHQLNPAKLARTKLIVMTPPAVTQDDIEELYLFARRAREAMNAWRANPAAALNPTLPAFGNELRSFFRFAGARGYVRSGRRRGSFRLVSLRAESRKNLDAMWRLGYDAQRWRKLWREKRKFIRAALRAGAEVEEGCHQAFFVIYRVAGALPQERKRLVVR
jgi:hypothetical protein